MKKIASLLVVSVFAGAITLGGYKMFFEQHSYVFTENTGTPFAPVSYTPTSAKGAGINEVDFTTAAETTVNAVVHVKNVTINSGPKSIMATSQMPHHKYKVLAQELSSHLTAISLPTIMLLMGHHNYKSP